MKFYVRLKVILYKNILVFLFLEAQPIFELDCWMYRWFNVSLK